jgi:two-component system NarL family sensor kinase
MSTATISGSPTRQHTLPRVLAGAALTVVILDVALTAWLMTRADVAVLLDSFLLTDAMIGLAFAVCGALVTFFRQRNAVGWLLLAVGVGYAQTAGLASALGLGLVPNEVAARWVLTIALASWPPAISGLLAAALILFPTGRVINWWWWIVLACCLCWSVLFTLTMVVLPADSAEAFALAPELSTYAPITDPEVLALLTTLQGPLALISYGGAIAALLWCYRHGNDVVRRQLLWVVLAGLLVFGGLLVFPISETDFPVAPLFAITLIPASITIAIVRHRLLDIRLVFSRTVLYLLMAALAVGAYLAIVVAVNWMVEGQTGLGGSLLATVVVAIAFNPVRVFLQRAVDRLFYGTRNEPSRALEALTPPLADPGAGLDESLAQLRSSLKLPWLAVLVDGEITAESGARQEGDVEESLPLPTHQNAQLRVAARSGEQRLSRQDRQLLSLLAGPLGSAVRLRDLAAELDRSRTGVLDARQDERERLRRDLHDGLGPSLTAIVLKADAARRLVGSHTDRAAELIADVRADASLLSAEVRRLIEDLRPPVLDELGLVAAIERESRRFTRGLGGNELTVTTDAPSRLPPLGSDLETAVYRITAEALTNVSRHSRATEAHIRLEVFEGALHMEVRDNGGPGAAWVPGVGLRSMQQRAAGLGGVVDARPTPEGGLVSLRIPITLPAKMGRP